MNTWEHLDILTQSQLEIPGDVTCDMTFMSMSPCTIINPVLIGGDLINCLSAFWLLMPWCSRHQVITSHDIDYTYCIKSISQKNGCLKNKTKQQPKQSKTISQNTWDLRLSLEEMVVIWFNALLSLRVLNTFKMTVFKGCQISFWQYVVSYLSWHRCAKTGCIYPVIVGTCSTRGGAVR